MKSTVDQLTKSEREALANLHDTEAYKALVRIRDIEVLAFAAAALQAPNMETVNYLRGETVWANSLINTLEEIYKKSQG